VDSIPTVRRMLRNLSHGFTRAACPACGRAVLDSEAVQLHGQRFHRRCAFYSTPRSATEQGFRGDST
jgi:hypothetical protein